MGRWVCWCWDVDTVVKRTASLQHGWQTGRRLETGGRSYMGGWGEWIGGWVGVTVL